MEFCLARCVVHYYSLKHAARDVQEVDRALEQVHLLKHASPKQLDCSIAWD